MKYSEIPVPLIGNHPANFSAVYAIGPKEGRPLKIGYARKLNNRLSDIQVANWVELFIHYNVWVADSRVARRVEKACHEVLDKANRRINKEWFDITVEWAKKVIWFAGQDQKIPLYTNKDVGNFSISKEEYLTRQLLWETNIMDNNMEKKNR